MVWNVYESGAREVRLEDYIIIRAPRKAERIEDYPFDSSLPYLDLHALETGEVTKYAATSNAVVDESSLVIVKDGYRSGKVMRGQKGVAGSTLAVLTPDTDELLPGYLYSYLTYRYDDLQGNSRGTTINHLNTAYLRHMMIPLPSRVTQEQVGEKYQRVEMLAKQLQQDALKLKEVATRLGNKELQIMSEQLSGKAEQIMRAWLQQIFER